MENVVSKSIFKPHALKYFRQVQKTGKALIITDHSVPVLKIIPYTEDPMAALKTLRGSVLQYEGPTDPVGLEDWEALK
ncbi:MAG: type II toxin-antitoxin system Phd/YefM family antitoxin [Deltaproteobacteria bacterium]|nr:type II toxin-antitoxin system Phd/YefM family antitoxin [Deltaproteobacteria bacterium]